MMSQVMQMMSLTVVVLRYFSIRLTRRPILPLRRQAHPKPRHRRAANQFHFHLILFGYSCKYDALKKTLEKEREIFQSSVLVKRVYKFRQFLADGRCEEWSKRHNNTVGDGSV
jgi:hypothetical protein